jgi:hypothetical protein
MSQEKGNVGILTIAYIFKVSEINVTNVIRTIVIRTTVAWPYALKSNV